MNTVIVEDTTVLRTRDLETRFNLAPDSRTFDCKFIEPGIISYRDQERGGIELLKKETLDRCMASVIGNPITDGHVLVNAENRMTVEEGIVQEYYYNSANGWYHVKGTADTKNAQAKMQVKRPSCGYVVTGWGPGGMYHGIRYDKEITEIKFNHLAIVDKPRYEDATFRLNTSVSNPTNMKLFKFLQKLVTRENGADGKPVEASKDITTEIPCETQVDIGDGQMVRLNDLADVWMKQTAAAAVSRANGDDEVEIEGKRVKMNELVDCYKKNAVRTNAATVILDKSIAPATATAAAAIAAAADVVAADVAAKRAASTAAHFTLHAARDNAAAVSDNPVASGEGNSDSLRDRVARGAKRY